MSKNGIAVLATAEKNEMKLIPLQTGKEVVNAEEKKSSEFVKDLPIEDLKNRAVSLTLLNQKHDDLTEKRKRLERFAIVHDHDNAKITVIDAQGEEFMSNSPKSIKRLIEFWKEEFLDAISENEKQIKAMFA